MVVPGPLQANVEEVVAVVGVVTVHHDIVRTAAPVHEIQTDRSRDLVIGTITLILVQVIRFGIAAHHIQVNVAITVIVRSGNAAAESLRVGELRQHTTERSLVQPGVDSAAVIAAGINSAPDINATANFVK